MNYRRRNEKKIKKFFFIGLLLLILLAAYPIISPKTDYILAETLQRVAFPVWKSSAFVSEKLSLLKAFVNSRLSLAEENRRLKREISETRLTELQNKVLRMENSHLQELLGREDASLAIPAFILLRPPQTLYDVLIIDIGKNSGLKGGERVFFKNILLGEIVKVFEKTATVKLLSSGGSQTNAFIERVNLPIIAMGRGSGNFEAKLPQDATVELGDFIIVPEKPGILLGQIEEIERLPTSSFLRILFRLPINISEIRWVLVEV